MSGCAYVASYYINGKTAQLEDMMSRDVLDTFVDQLTKLQHTLATVGRTHNPLWLGETSSCYGGGAPGLSDSYVAGFMWALWILYNNYHKKY